MKKFLTEKAAAIRREFENNPKIAECITEAAATAALESLNWLDYDLTPGTKISMARFALQANKANRKNRSRQSRFDRPMRNESRDDFDARMLTGKYDV